MTAVDTWEGSASEGGEHVTVVRVRERDVFATFRENVRRLGCTHVVPRREEVTKFLRSAPGPIKFCHIDAAHDCAAVREPLELLLPRLVPGAVLVGHNYETARAGRADLGGGDECPRRSRTTRTGDNWWYAHRTEPRI